MSNSIIGQKFNRLTVIGIDIERTERIKRKHYICQCECGNIRAVRINKLKNGEVKSCKPCAHTSHGLTKHPVYKIYINQIDRCNNPKNNYYNSYGARGICVEYSLEEFSKWYDDNLKPSPEHSIDRIDNNGNYSLNNIRWADKTTQSVNRESMKEVKGIRKRYNNAWIPYISIGGKRYEASFDNYEDAVWWRCMMEVKREVEEEKKVFMR